MDIPGDPARLPRPVHLRATTRAKSDPTTKTRSRVVTHHSPSRNDARPQTATPLGRYALLDKVRRKATAFEERYRKNGKGFVRPWEVNPELKSVIDPVAHVADDEKK